MAYALRLILILACLAPLGGCLMKVAYEQAEWWVPWYVDDYLPLDRAQRRALAQELQALRRWHRHAQLPAYAALLRRIREDVERGLDHRRLEDHFRSAIAFWNRLAERTAPHAARLLAGASDAQVAALLENLEESEAEFREQWVAPPPERIAARRVEALTRRLEDWIGTLDPLQRQLAADWAGRLLPTGEQRLEHRRLRRGRLGRLLEERRDRARLERGLAGLLRYREDRWPEALAGAFAHNRGLTLLMLSRIASHLGPQQRDRLVARLDRLAAELEAIAGRRGA